MIGLRWPAIAHNTIPYEVRERMPDNNMGRTSEATLSLAVAWMFIPAAVSKPACPPQKILTDRLFKIVNTTGQKHNISRTML